MTTLKEKLEPIAKAAGMWSMIQNFSDVQLLFFVNSIMGTAPKNATFEELQQHIQQSPYGCMLNVLNEDAQRQLWDIYQTFVLKQQLGPD